MLKYAIIDKQAPHTFVVTAVSAHNVTIPLPSIKSSTAARFLALCSMWLKS